MGLIVHNYFSPFLEMILIVCKSCPRWFLSLLMLSWWPRDLSVGLIFCDLPSGKCLLCCPTVAAPMEWHKDVQLPGGTAAPDYMQIVFFCWKRGKKYQKNPNKTKKKTKGKEKFPFNLVYLFALDRKPNFSKESKQFSSWLSTNCQPCFQWNNSVTSFLSVLL